MKVNFAVMADAANTSDNGKLNVLGIFAAASSDKLPVLLSHVTAAFELEVERESELGQIFAVSTRLIKENLEPIWETPHRIMAIFERNPNVPEIMPSSTFIVSMVAPAFPSFGRYYMQVLVDDVVKEVVGLNIYRS